MLKSVLGDWIKEKIYYKDDDIGNEEVEDGIEEILFQYSDGIVEYGLKKIRLGFFMYRKLFYRFYLFFLFLVNKCKQFYMERKRQCKLREIDIN